MAMGVSCDSWHVWCVQYASCDMTPGRKNKTLTQEKIEKDTCPHRPCESKNQSATLGLLSHSYLGKES